MSNKSIKRNYAIMGVTKAAKFLDMKAPEVVFFGAHELPNQAI